MLRCELAGRRQESAFLGAAGSAGDGGSDLSLLGLNGTFWQVAGCLVKACGGLNWSVEVCGGSCGLGWFSGRNWSKCLWWMVGAVVRAGLKAWVV